MQVPLPSGDVLEGDLVVPADAVGLVVFAHGSGSSRHSPRNRRRRCGTCGSGASWTSLGLSSGGVILLLDAPL